MSRRYPTAELYEERQRDFYRNGNRSDRSYDDLDPRRSAPDFFLREDYDRPSSNAGPLVVRERREESVKGPPSRRGREVEEDTLVIRGGRPEPRLREREIDDISIRRGPERERPRAREREVERDETDIYIKHQHRDQSRPRRAPDVREIERDEITFRRGEGGPPSRPRPREVDVEREEIRFREREPPRPREVERDEFIYRRDESHGREREVEKDTITIRGRERSLPPPRSRGELVAREREEFVIRRRPSPPRSPPREEIKDEIIIRRMEQRSPTPPPPPPPPPEPEPIVRPPIIQEVITHHRHIDHGKSSNRA
ncbi:hypothetical protein GQ43DRAFT_46208 [Delitschia confertaspora ATCC 74209]|uniref:Uncharacterized protein n=1 Tax=Delitschia confertaspora ATCC 74209 TaxID=1513339 RepID=A0A9P4JL57_9PLEO|nr:hypothetical protein GQ43DRAFT_46208 [Delitschia confertaspora ATCC 74209]